MKLAAPGEIREEYQKQLSVQKEIYRLEREKEDKLSQELLKKLQEQEELNRIKYEETIKKDEEIAKRLADSLSNTSLLANKSSSSNGLSQETKVIKYPQSRQALPTNIIYNYDYNIKKIQSNNVGKNFGTQVNALNPQTSCEQSKLPTSASKYDCLIKSFSMKLAQGKDVMKQGSPKTQQLHAMSLLQELGQTYDDNDEFAKKYDSITQELCHFKPIKTALITKRRLVNGKPVINPLAISPPRRPIPRTQKLSINEVTTFTLKGTKVLKYSGAGSAFAAHPTIYFCNNLVISGYEEKGSNNSNLIRSKKRLFDNTDQNKNIKQPKIQSDDEIIVLPANSETTESELTLNFVNTPKKTYSNIRVKYNSKSPKKSKSSAKDLFGIKPFERLTNMKFSDDFKPLGTCEDFQDTENSNDDAFNKKLLQEQKDLEFAKKLQDYLNKCDNDDRPYTLRKNNTKNNYLVSDYKRGTRTSPRKRQTTLDSIFLSTHK